jgi:Tfp pilus assembly protein PilF
MGNEADAKAKRVLAQAYLRNKDFARAVREAQQALSLGDEPSINKLILACAARHQGDGASADRFLTDAKAVWPEVLQNEGGFIASAGMGDLWIESADERLALAIQAAQTAEP